MIEELLLVRRPIVKTFLIVTASYVCVAVLYFLFRLVAQRYNIIMHGLSDNFRYSICVLLWPSFALLAGGIPLFASAFVKVRWYLLPIVFILAVVVWDQMFILDSVLDIPGGGLIGFKTYASNSPSFNSTKLSVYTCPCTFFLGATAGLIVGLMAARRKRGALMR